jgi:branched-chain amino acid transport system ATP-binding protein
VFEIRGLSGGWGSTVVVEDFNLRIEAGETVAVIGRNGVGKSTLLELSVGRARRQHGQILLDGRDLAMLPVHRRARDGLGYVPQSREVFPSLTVQEHFGVAARPGAWSVARVLELFPRLAERLDSFGTQLSGGEQQMLAVARALLGNPRVLLMDEPFEGLAPIVVEHFVNAIRQIVADGSLAMLLVEQRVDIALDLSHRCMVMDRGRCVFEGLSEGLSEQGSALATAMGLVH